MLKLGPTLAAGLVALGASLHAGAAPGRTRSATDEAPDGPTPATSVPDTTSPALALSGLAVAFSSDATNIVGGDTNAVADVFVRRLDDGTLLRASVGSDGEQANGPSYSPAMSVDGRYVAFASRATNLVAGDSNDAADVFLKDLRTGRVRRVSVSSKGRESDGESNTPFVSLFGEWVGFESAAANLTRGDANGLPDAFVHEVRRGTTARIAPPPLEPRDPDAIPWGEAPRVPRLSAAGEEVPTWWIPSVPREAWPDERPFDEPDTTLRLWTARPTISYDGRWVTYARGATTTDPTRPDAFDVFVLDTETSRSSRVAAPSWGGHTKSLNRNPVISADGRRVALESWVVATKKDLMAPNPFDFQDVLIYDRASGTFWSASNDAYGRQGNGHSWGPTISAGGDAVAFVSEATNLVAGDTNGQPDVFVRDSRTRTISRISLGPGGAEADGASARPSMSYEGRLVAFASVATNIADGGGGVLLHDRELTLANAAPRFRTVRAPRRIDPIVETVVRLRARDADGDPVRFAPALPMPTLSSLDPRTGELRWRPLPDEAGERYLAFYAQDPAGLTDLLILRFVVRDVADP